MRCDNILFVWASALVMAACGGDKPATPPMGSGAANATTEAPSTTAAPPSADVAAPKAGEPDTASAPPSALETLLAERPEAARTEHFATTLAALQEAAKANAASKRAPSWVTFSARWKALKDAVGPLFKAYRAPDAASAEPPRDIVLAGLSLLRSDDEYERAAGLQLVGMALQDWRVQKHPDTARWREVLVEQIHAPGASEDDRYELISTLGHTMTAAEEPLFLDTLAVDPSARVRTKALTSLQACVSKKVCTLTDATRVRKLVAGEAEPGPKNALFWIAGRLGMEDLHGWCGGKLAEDPLSAGCRVGLSRLRTEKAFDMLYGWIDALKDDPSTVKEGNYGFRDAFALLNGFAELPFAKDRYYALIDVVLGQKERNGFATGIIARQLAWLKDTDRAAAIAKKHRATYGKLWKGTKEKHQQFVLDELDKTIANLKGKGGLRIDRPIR